MRYVAMWFPVFVVWTAIFAVLCIGDKWNWRKINLILAEAAIAAALTVGILVGIVLLFD